MKIVFWGSSDFSMPSLEMIRANFDLRGIVTNPDSHIGRGYCELHQTPMKICATDHCISCIQPESLKSDEFFGELQELEADLYVVVSYGKIIPDRMIYLPPKASINLHASILPKYRGASPIQGALANGETMTGNTVQFITKELDKGDVIAQSRMQIDDDDNYKMLTQKLAMQGAELLKEAIIRIENGTATRTKQDDSAASYTKILKKEDGEIDFGTMSARQIWNRFRAFSGWPGIYANANISEKEVKVMFTKIGFNDKIYGKAGQIIKADKNGLWIACREGTLEIFRIKPAGKNEMDYNAFINGYRLKTETSFVNM